MKGHDNVRGQSLVEFALLLPLLILILVGVLDLGRAFNSYIVITNAARNGAYYGSMNPSDSTGIVQRVLGETQGSGVTLTSDNVTVTSGGTVGTPVQVTVRYDFHMLTSFLPGLQTIHLASQTEMMIVR